MSLLPPQFDPMQYIRIAVIVVVVLLFPAGYLKGCSDEKERFDSWKGAQEAIGKAQEDRTIARITSDRQSKEASDNVYKVRIDRLNTLAGSLSDELQRRSRSSIVPPIPAPPAGSGAGEIPSGIVCFSRDRLSEGISRELQSFAGRYAEGVQRGAIAIAGFQACSSWALEESAKPR